MTNQSISNLDRDSQPKRGEVGFDPILEEEDNQDLGGLAPPPEDEAASLGEAESLGHMEVEDEDSDAAVAELPDLEPGDSEIEAAAEADRPL